LGKANVNAFVLAQPRAMCSLMLRIAAICAALAVASAAPKPSAADAWDHVGPW